MPRTESMPGVEDGIRTGKDCGLGRFPSFDFGINSAWLAASLTAATLLSWLRLTALDGDLARAEPKALRSDPARRRKAGPRRTPPTAENPRNLALGRRHSHRLDPDHRPAAGTLTSSNPFVRARKEHPGTRGTPARPAAGPTSYPDRKIRNYPAAQPLSRTSHPSA
jgi:hypothetical protein